MTVNIHERLLPAPPEEVGELIDSLSSDADRLWPSARWPPMRFDAPLGVGARGGHGPIRYSVVRYEPGRSAAFRFEPSLRVIGEHRLETERAEGGTLVRHVIVARMRGRMALLWPLAVRWLHDALIEDCFDRAHAQLTGARWTPRPLGRWVRLLRRLSQVRSRSWRSTK